MFAVKIKHIAPGLAITAEFQQAPAPLVDALVLTPAQHPINTAMLLQNLLRITKGLGRSSFGNQYSVPICSNRLFWPMPCKTVYYLLYQIGCKNFGRSAGVPLELQVCRDAASPDTVEQ